MHPLERARVCRPGVSDRPPCEVAVRPVQEPGGGSAEAKVASRARPSPAVPPSTCKRRVQLSHRHRASLCLSCAFLSATSGPMCESPLVVVVVRVTHMTDSAVEGTFCAGRLLCPTTPALWRLRSRWEAASQALVPHRRRSCCIAAATTFSCALAGSAAHEAHFAVFSSKPVLCHSSPTIAQACNKYSCAPRRHPGRGRRPPHASNFGGRLALRAPRALYYPREETCGGARALPRAGGDPQLGGAALAVRILARRAVARQRENAPHVPLRLWPWIHRGSSSLAAGRHASPVRAGSAPEGYMVDRPRRQHPFDSNYFRI